MISSLVLRDFESKTKGVEAPIVNRWSLEPYFLTGLRFKRWSMVHLTDGYNKVGLLSSTAEGTSGSTGTKKAHE